MTNSSLARKLRSLYRAVKSWRVLPALLGLFTLCSIHLIQKLWLPSDVAAIHLAAVRLRERLTNNPNGMNGDRPRLRFLLRPDLNCTSRLRTEAVRTVVVVKSSAIQFEIRRAIRESWGGAARLRRPTIDVIFVVGRPLQPQLRALDARIYGPAYYDELIRRESEAHGDILQADFLESYNNLTLKTLAIFQWEAEACWEQSETYFFNVDDDCFVFLDALASLIATNPLSTNDGDAILGDCRMSAVLVKIWGKNAVPRSAWPYWRWPPYCTGTGYLMFSRVAQKVLKEIPSLAWLQTLGNVDDVVFSGILAQKAGIKLIPNEHIHYWKLPRLDPCDTNIISAHYVTADETRAFWKDYANRPESCA